MTRVPLLLELVGVKVERGCVPVLDVPSFRLLAGEFVSHVGPNGSGKSTLLLTVMCLLRRLEGRILHRGEEVRTDGDALALRRKIAMVLQDPLLFDATVHENVASGLHFRGVGRAETRRRVATCLERFNLAHMADRSARKLSGGEAQRVSLARAFVLEPELLLLDEPFAALDPPSRARLLEDLSALLKENNRTAVFVTHNLNEAAKLSHRIAVMVGGMLRQVGTELNALLVQAKDGPGKTYLYRPKPASVAGEAAPSEAILLHASAPVPPPVQKRCARGVMVAVHHPRYTNGVGPGVGDWDESSARTATRCASTSE